MAAGAAAAELLVRCVFDGCLSLSDADMEWRPYHRNCNCPLHKSKGDACYNNGLNRKKKVTYPMRRAWSESCLVLAASKFASSSSSPGNVLLGVEKNQLGLCKEEESD